MVRSIPSPRLAELAHRWHTRSAWSSARAFLTRPRQGFDEFLRFCRLDFPERLEEALDHGRADRIAFQRTRGLDGRHHRVTRSLQRFVDSVASREAGPILPDPVQGYGEVTIRVPLAVIVVPL
jgi:hypothetical protein